MCCVKLCFEGCCSAKRVLSNHRNCFSLVKVLKLFSLCNSANMENFGIIAQVLLMAVETQENQMLSHTPDT